MEHPLHRTVGVEHQGAAHLAGRRADPGGEQPARGPGRRRRAGGELGTLELADVRRGHRRQRVAAREPGLAHEVRGDPDRRLRGALGAAHLEQVEAAPLDGELDVEDVAEHLLEPGALGAQLVEERWQPPARRGDLLGGRGAGDDVLALATLEVLAVELGVAGHRVAGEDHPGARRAAEVAEDHRLHHHRGAEVVGDAVEVAIGDRTPVVPGAEDRLDRTAELLARVAWHLLPHLVHDRALAGGPELVVEGAGVGGVARMRDELARSLGDGIARGAENDLRVHPVEAHEDVGHEAPVAARLGDRHRGLAVDAEVEDGVHHPRHRHRRPRADREQQRHRARAEALAGVPLQGGEVLEHLGEQPRGDRAVRGDAATGVGGDDEPGRGGEALGGEPREPRPLAAEEAHLAVVGLAEGEHEPRRLERARTRPVPDAEDVAHSLRARPMVRSRSSWNSNQTLWTESTVGVET